MNERSSVCELQLRERACPYLVIVSAIERGPVMRSLISVGRCEGWVGFNAGCHVTVVERIGLPITASGRGGSGLMLVVMSCRFGIYRSVENGPPSYS